MNFTDAVSIMDTKVTADGYLIGTVRAARAGIQIYSGQEMGKPEMGKVRVYRPEDEVFHADAMASLAHRTVTVDHPKEFVTAKNWRKHAVGFTAAEVARDGGFIRVPLAVLDAAAVQSVRDGKQQLSVGYSCDIDWTAGATADGQPYDAVQRNIRANHLAIVDAARAGPECRIGDEDASLNKGGRHMTDNTLKTVMVDGIPIVSTDQAATVIDTLQRRLADATTAATKAQTDHTAAVGKLTGDHAAAIAAKDKELGTKDAEIEKLKANQIDAAKLDTLVADRAEVLAKARSISDKVETSGKTNGDIRRAAVAAKLGDAKVKDRSDDYVLALFDSLAADAPKTSGRDPVRDALINGGAHRVDDRDTAYDAMSADLANAWKSGGAAQKEIV